MRRLAMTLAAMAVLAVGNSAKADGWRHSRYHDDLDHREFHRELYHGDAHRYPMSWRQHERVHDELDHDRFHDYREHRSYHRYHYRPYSYYGGGYYAPGIGVRTGNFSLWLGR